MKNLKKLRNQKSRNLKQKEEKIMEFLINRELLKEELGFMQGIVEKKATIAALSNILFKSVGKDKVRITGSNLDVTMHIECPAKILKEGMSLVNAKKIFDISRLLDAEEIHFLTEENSWIRIESNNARFKIASMPVDEYPEVPDSAKTGLKLISSDVLTFMKMTSFAISQEQSRYLLSAAKLLTVNGANNEKKLRMVTTDGHRLAMIEKSLTDSSDEVGNLDILIPKRVLQELSRICRGGDSNSIEFGEDERHLYFSHGNSVLIARKLVGNFPNYEAVIPKESPFTAEFEPLSFSSALKRVSLMADEMSHAVKITLKKDEALIEAFSQDGEAKEVIPIVYDGEEFTVGFNSQYIQDFLDVVLSATESYKEGDSEEEIEADKVKVKVSEGGKIRIKFEFRDSNSQVLMRPVGLKGYDYIYVVMPLRL